MSAFQRRVVGIRYPQWSSFGPGTLGGVVDFMRDHHQMWRLVTENDSYGEMEAIRITGDWRGSGLILFRSTEAELATFRKRGIPVVLTSTEGPDLGFPRVVPDNPAIGREAARHLLGCGLDSYAFLARGETFYREAHFAPGFRVYARERLRGFRAELAERSIEPTIHYLRGRPLWEARTWREVQTEVCAFLATLPKPCGLFVVDDSLAAVALCAADTLGRRVPDELAVIGYGDDQVYCYASMPALSSMVHPAREVGRLAAELLWRQMEGEQVSGTQTVPPGETVERESSRVLAIDDRIVSDLVAWIRLKAVHDPIRVSELCERAGLSSTTLKERFARSIGHPPKQEIQQVRLKHLERLLSRPGSTLAGIATQMGFASAHELSRFFKSATGLRPSEFRQARGNRRTGPKGFAVVFDMDGTLFDSESFFFRAFAHAYREQGESLSREDYFRRFAGTTNAHIERELERGAGRDFNRTHFSRAWRDEFNRLIEEEGLQPFADVLRALDELAALGVPLALASSSDLADIGHLLRSAGLAARFESITGGDEVPRSKPDPAIFKLAARRLGYPPEHCVAVEDSAAGVKAARAAGMRVIHVAREPRGGIAVADPSTRSVASLDAIDWRTMAESILVPSDDDAAG
ncbi:HAD-IA family hydrolase [Haloferula sargassicola]|uniref:Phosphoglycolate phosphatase n=1 Tax=Haloferula sargassicola TaxID=490096 RepID=A0ABP9UMY8_9BACT